MKKLKKLIPGMLLVGTIILPVSLHGQFGNIKIKNPINTTKGGNKKETPPATNNQENSSGTTTTNTTTSNTTAPKKKLGYYKVDQPTCVFSTEYGFESAKTEFETGENCFIRVAFPKPVGEFYAEQMGRSDVPSSGDLIFAIAKNIDDEDPIVLYSTTIFTSRFTEDNVLDFTLQASDQFFDDLSSHKGDVDQRVSFNSIGLMSNPDIKMQWDNKISALPSTTNDWEVFVVFKPWGSNDETQLKQVVLAKSKFKYTYNAEKARAAFAAKIKPRSLVADEGMTSDLHKKFVNKIIFSKNEIPKTGASESAFVNSFNLGDDIYTRIFMDKSLINELRTIGADDSETSTGRSLALNIYVDGKLFACMPGTDKNYQEDGSYYHFSPIDGTFDKQTTTTIETSLSHMWGIPSDKGKAYHGLMLDFFYNTWMLSDGAHKIKLDLVLNIPPNGATPDRQYRSAFGNERILATGEFTINTSAAGKVTTGKKICAMPDIQEELSHYNDGLKKMTQATEWVKKGINAETTLIKVVDGSDWTYSKNGYGIITHRTLWGMAFLKDNKTGLYYTRRIDFTEQNISSGGAKYGATTWDFLNFDYSGKRFCKECIK